MELNYPHQDHEEASVSLKILLLVFAAILVGVLGYLVWQQNHTSDTTDYSSPKKTESSTVTTTDDSTKKTSGTSSTPPKTSETEVINDSGVETETASWSTVYGALGGGFEGYEPTGKEGFTWKFLPGYVINYWGKSDRVPSYNTTSVQIDFTDAITEPTGFYSKACEDSLVKNQAGLKKYLINRNGLTVDYYTYYGRSCLYSPSPNGGTPPDEVSWAYAFFTGKNGIRYGMFATGGSIDTFRKVAQTIRSY